MVVFVGFFGHILHSLGNPWTSLNDFFFQNMQTWKFILYAGNICGFSFLCDYLETRSLYIRNPHFEILGLATPGPPSPNLLQPTLPFGRAKADPHGPCVHCTHVPSLPSTWAFSTWPQLARASAPVHSRIKSSLPPPQPSTWTSLSLSLPLCKIGTLTPTLQSCFED